MCARLSLVSSSSTAKQQGKKMGLAGEGLWGSGRGPAGGERLRGAGAGEGLRGAERLRGGGKGILRRATSGGRGLAPASSPEALPVGASTCRVPSACTDRRGEWCCGVRKMMYKGKARKEAALMDLIERGHAPDKG